MTGDRVVYVDAEPNDYDPFDVVLVGLTGVVEDADTYSTGVIYKVAFDEWPGEPWVYDGAPFERWCEEGSLQLERCDERV